jgi:hypothetical protein
MVRSDRIKSNPIDAESSYHNKDKEYKEFHPFHLCISNLYIIYLFHWAFYNIKQANKNSKIKIHIKNN